MATRQHAPIWLQRVDGSGLRFFRFAFGVLLAVAMLRYFANGWIESQFLTPTTFFPFFGWDWVSPLPAAGMYAVFVLMFAAAVLLAAGRFHRVSALALALGFAYTQIIDKTNYLNHYYLFFLLLILLSVLPAGRRPGGRVPFGAYGILRIQVGLVYFFAGIHKLQSDWILEAQPLRIWLLHAQDSMGGPGWLSADSVAYLASWGGAAFDIAIPFLLLWRRTRVPAYALLVVFHVLTAVLFPIGLFPWVMIAIATVFFDPAWPSRVLQSLRPRAVAQAAPSPTRRSASLRPVHARLWLGAAVFWCAIQVLLPMRAMAYPGDGLWTEQGFRFSWKVMLIEKYGTAEFDVRDPIDGSVHTHHPADDLTFIQERMMAHQPDMILQYAHVLRDRYARTHGRVPSVFVRGRVMLNGRPSQPLVDPQIDLARESSGIAPKLWLLPSPRESIPKTPIVRSAR